jgi:hypothetical protein
MPPNLAERRQRFSARLSFGVNLVGVRAKPVVPLTRALRDIDEAIDYSLGQYAEGSFLGFECYAPLLAPGFGASSPFSIPHPDSLNSSSEASLAQARLNEIALRHLGGIANDLPPWRAP